MSKGSARRPATIGRREFGKRHEATYAGKHRLRLDPCNQCSRPGKLIYHAGDCPHRVVNVRIGHVVPIAGLSR